MTQATYYDRPLLKTPVWKWMIPAYFFVGGIAGASMALGGVVQALGGRAMRPFASRCFLIGATGGTVSSVLLIADLGKPSRFLNMLRVFRLTSPMSIGSWILSSATGCSTGAVVLPGPAGRFAGYCAAILGVPLSGYTGVLLANTAVPVWQESRKSLPVLFTASAMASAGSILKLIPACDRDHRIANTFAVTGAIVEFAAGKALERECARVPLVAKALHRGVPGVLWNAAKLFTMRAYCFPCGPPASQCANCLGSSGCGGIAVRAIRRVRGGQVVGA